MAEGPEGDVRQEEYFRAGLSCSMGNWMGRRKPSRFHLITLTWVNECNRDFATLADSFLVAPWQTTGPFGPKQSRISECRRHSRVSNSTLRTHYWHSFIVSSRPPFRSTKSRNAGRGEYTFSTCHREITKSRSHIRGCSRQSAEKTPCTSIWKQDRQERSSIVRVSYVICRGR